MKIEQDLGRASKTFTDALYEYRRVKGILNPAEVDEGDEQV